MITDIWSYLTEGSLVWLAMTVGAYVGAERLWQLSGRKAWGNPIMVAILTVSGTLLITGTSYQTYFEGAQFVHFLLGPATVCLAVPLYTNLGNLRKTALPLLVALVVGALVAMLSALLLAKWLGLEGELLISLAPKSVTAPVAIGISERIGGLPTLTAAMVLITGVIGALIVTPLLNAIGVRDWRARGFSAGVAAHGIGTARAFQVHRTAGAFAGIGMALNALLTSVLAPYVLALIQ
ncbi:LrgB family protein [Pseudooceanicola sp. HF7]|uniref:LrgB family protein n=1 Tax=Pseudooceanicola sp. HF7 TaxID=2721560 RepID=UPI00142FDA61|nr:LrgB family protein [Pseudooceanicola sp. HF7]NIZ10726.1 LrgB family protein [Pseudooceanicola sp. HF7]